MIHDIVNCAFNKLFRQLDMIIINFGEPIKISIHALCFVRIFKDSTILLTSSDEFFDKNGNELKEHASTNTYSHTDKSLLDINIKKVNKLLKGEVVTKVNVSDLKDVTITFGNDVKVQILPDCLMKDYEYYRFIKFIPYLDEEQKRYQSEHYVVSNNNGIVVGSMQ